MTKQQITFNTLDSYFCNTDNNTLNVSYFLENIYTQLDVVYRHDKIKREYFKNLKRININSIIWGAFMDMTNDYIINEGYDNYRCSSEQLKKYLANYDYDYSIFTDNFKNEIIDLIKDFQGN